MNLLEETLDFFRPSYNPEENIYMNFDKFNLGPADISKIKTFVGGHWNSLKEINEDKNEN